MALEAGDDAAVAGDFTVPSAGLGVLAQGDLVGELGLQLRQELGAADVVVALLTDVGVGACLGRPPVAVAHHPDESSIQLRGK